jgi:hypothetical protein
MMTIAVRKIPEISRQMIDEAEERDPRNHESA